VFVLCMGTGFVLSLCHTIQSYCYQIKVFVLCMGTGFIPSLSHTIQSYCYQIKKFVLCMGTGFVLSLCCRIHCVSVSLRIWFGMCLYCEMHDMTYQNDVG
jgi:hypothetical protein